MTADPTEPIDQLHIPTRTWNTLRRAGIDTVGDLADRTAADLLDLHGFGARGLDLVVSELGTRGLCLRLRDPRACSCGATGTDTCPAHGCYGTEPW